MSTTHKPRPYQGILIQEILHAWFVQMMRVVLAVLPTGGGKCLARDTPVLMFDGTVKMVQDVKVGDMLMGPDSQPRWVQSLARGQENMWRVVPHKGEPFTVNESHILSLKITRGAKGITAPNGKSLHGGEIVNVTVGEYLSSTKTFKHVAKTWRTAVDFAPVADPLPLPAYILGAWLGDGTSCRCDVTTGDAEIFHEFDQYAASTGMKVKIISNSTGSFTMQMHGDGKRYGRGGSPMGNALRELDVLNNKHVPHHYRTASRADRLELLAGVLDTDGCNEGKGYSLTLKSERLMDDVVFVARSLGFSCTKRAVRKTCGNNGVTGDYWTCHINGPVDDIPCRVERKKAAPRLQIKDVLMTGFDLEPMGVGDYYGFDLAGNDRLFLLGDFTVTHNTFIFAHIIAMTQGPVCAIVHRGELVTQISLALAREGVRHRIIGSAATARACSIAHMEELGRDFVSPTSRVAVASVDTLVRMDPNDPWFAQVVLWVGDEGHHFLRDNKWGRAVALFINARGLLVTATPARADGKGLGRIADGFADCMVIGPNPRDLIDLTFLCDYRIINKPSDIDLSQVTTSESGDYSPPKLAAARAKSHITGDVVEHYLQYAAGKRGITFDVDVASATDTAAAFRSRGVAAEVVTGKTPDEVRRAIIRRFRSGDVLQLVNVDLFGEGFDLPAIEVVSMARPTQSYGLYIQSFGRALRPMQGKDKAIIIDHVGNVARHGLPDAPREWSLDRREKRARSGTSDAIPTRTCMNPGSDLGPEVPCASVYERYLKACPFCGFPVTVTNRSGPEHVDGVLAELDPAVLAKMRGETAKVMQGARMPVNVTPEVRNAIINNHHRHQTSQVELRQTMNLWSGWQLHLGRSTDEQDARFYYRYGVDRESAQAYSRNDAIRLRERIVEELNRHNVVAKDA